MPPSNDRISYSIDAGTRLVTMKLSGDLTTEDFKAFFRETSDDPAYSPDMHKLVDVTGVTGYPHGEDVRTIAHGIRQRNADKRIRIAVVVGAPLTVGMANAFMLQADLTGRFHLFNDKTSAMYWLLTGKCPEVEKLL